MLQHSGIKYLSFDQYRKMLDEEITITKNEGEEVGIRSVRARLGYPGRQLRHLNQRSDQPLARLRELEIARLADAGARLDLQLQTTDGREMDLTFKIRKPSGPVNHAALARIRWGRKEATLNHSYHSGFHLSLERARQMAESPIRMTVAGQEREIVSARIKTSDAQHQPGSNRLWREVSGKQLGHTLKEILRKARPGDWIGLYQVTSAEGFQTSFNILIKSEIDPRQLYASPSAARFLREGNRITLGNLPDLDLRKLAALQFRKGRRAVFKLDGERLSRETHDAVGARRITPWDVARHLDPEALETVILLLPGDHELRGMPVIKLKGEVLVRTKAPKATHQMMKARTEGAGSKLLHRFVINGETYDPAAAKRRFPTFRTDSVIILELDAERASRRFGAIGLNGAKVYEFNTPLETVDQSRTPPIAGRIFYTPDTEATAPHIEFRSDKGNKVAKIMQSEDEGRRKTLISVIPPSLDPAQQAESKVVSVNGLRVYPNRTRNQARVEFRLESDERRVQLHLIDLNGKLLHRLADGPLRAGMHQFQLAKSLAGSAGTFFVQLRVGEEVQTRKVIFVE